MVRGKVTGRVRGKGRVSVRFSLRGRGKSTVRVRTRCWVGVVLQLVLGLG